MNATANTRTIWRRSVAASTPARIRAAQIKTRARPFIEGGRFHGAMVLLVRFGELALKSPYVRRHLRDRLVGNIQGPFAPEGGQGPPPAGHRPLGVAVAHAAGPSQGLRGV